LLSWGPHASPWLSLRLAAGCSGPRQRSTDSPKPSTPGSSFASQIILTGDPDKFGPGKGGRRDKDSYVIQPGSTVATALSEGALAGAGRGAPLRQRRAANLVGPVAAR
jgi:hypothetical protein